MVPAGQSACQPLFFWQFPAEIAINHKGNFRSIDLSAPAVISCRNRGWYDKKGA
jgi:hypothetical protein